MNENIRSDDVLYMEAILSLAPGSAFGLGDDLSFEYFKNKAGIKQPTKEEIDAEVIRLQGEYDSQEYARKRQAEYPSIQECVHAILDDELVALQEKRTAVKTKYPKE